MFWNQKSVDFAHVEKNPNPQNPKSEKWGLLIKRQDSFQSSLCMLYPTTVPLKLRSHEQE